MRIGKSWLRIFLLGVLCGEVILVAVHLLMTWPERPGAAPAGPGRTEPYPAWIATSLYPVEIQGIGFDVEIGKGGAIATWGDRLVLAKRTGEIALLEEGERPAFRSLGLPQPFDLALQNRAKDPRYIGVRSLKIRPAERPGVLRLYLSTVENEIDGEDTCLRVVLKTLEIPEALLTEATATAPEGDWRRV